MKGQNPRRLAALWTIASVGIGAGCTGRISEVTSDAPPFEAAAGGAGRAGSASSTADGLQEFADAGPQPRNDAEPDSSGGAGGSAPSAPLVYCDAPTLVLMASCGNGSCHSNAGATIGDFAVSPERAVAFVDKVSVRDPSCGRIIDSRNYADSLILTKVTGTYPLHCGGRMPVGSFTITDDQIGCLASWLQQFQR